MSTWFELRAYSSLSSFTFDDIYYILVSVYFLCSVYPLSYSKCSLNAEFNIFWFVEILSNFLPTLSRIFSILGLTLLLNIFEVSE